VYEVNAADKTTSPALYCLGRQIGNTIRTFFTRRAGSMQLGFGRMPDRLERTGPYRSAKLFQHTVFQTFALGIVDDIFRLQFVARHTIHRAEVVGQPHVYGLGAAPE